MSPKHRRRHQHHQGAPVGVAAAAAAPPPATGEPSPSLSSPKPAARGDDRDRHALRTRLLASTLLPLVVAGAVQYWGQAEELAGMLRRVSLGRSSSPLATPAVGAEQQPLLQHGPPRPTAKDVMRRAKKLTCKDARPAKECAEMAVAGACEEAPGWMSVFCAASCGRCELLDPKVRCDPKTMNITMQNAVGPGDLGHMFQTLQSRTGLNVEFLSHDPPLVLIHNFITPTEAERILALTEKQLRRSTDQGQFDERGVQEQVVSEGRTSENAWCMHDCEKDAMVRNLTARISHAVNIPVVNFESFQVLRYLKGQKYDLHHDASEDENHMAAGGRILTFFLYLSNVDEGGETHFPHLNVKIKPVQYAAALWPSVFNHDPTQVDQRFKHAALPVIRGVKRAANVWIHLRDFMTPNKWGCTGSFD